MFRSALGRALLVLVTASAGACGGPTRAAESSVAPPTSRSDAGAVDASPDAAAVSHATDEFIEAMGAFMTLCNAPDCFEVLMLIGAHTMHQPRLDETLPKLADELVRVRLKDPQMQSAVVGLAQKARAAGEEMRSARAVAQ